MNDQQQARVRAIADEARSKMEAEGLPGSIAIMAAPDDRRRGEKFQICVKWDAKAQVCLVWKWVSADGQEAE